MSNVVDERVVEMRFDNKQFESGVQTSMGTLQKLKDALNFNKSAQSLDKLSTAVNNANFSGMTGAIQAVQDRFSTLGIIGMTALQELTSMAVNVGVSIVNHILRPLNQVQDLIVNGGKQRALNIEQAKYMIEGLGYEFEKLDDDINAAVMGTRYGYDEAAMAASQLAASGIEFANINGRTLSTTGEQLSDMGVSLTAISGVASMANTEYGRIADIFTRVAGNGKLMTMQLQQLSGYGLNIAAAMAKQWGKTEAEVREMVTQGKVDFEMFANAMYDSFADAALKADTTLTGVSANIRAAWKKIGMDFWTPIVENNSAYVKALGKFKNLVNNFIRPVTKAAAQGGWTDFVNMMAKGLDAFLSFEPLLVGIKKTVQSIIDAIASLNITDKVKNVFDYFSNIGKGIEQFYKQYELYYNNATQMVQRYSSLGKNYAKELAEELGLTEEKVREMIAKGQLQIKDYKDVLSFSKNGLNAGLSGEDIDRFEKIMNTIQRFSTIIQGIKSGIHIFTSFLSSLVKGFATLAKHLFPAADGFLTLGSSIAENVTSFDEWLTKNDIFNKAIEKIDEKVGPILDIIADKIKKFAEALAEHGPKFEDFKRVFEGLFNGISKIFNGIKNVFSQIIPFIKQGLEWLGDALGKAAEAVGDFLSNLQLNDVGNLAATGGAFAVIGAILDRAWTFIKSIGSGGNFFTKAIESFNLLQDTLRQYQYNIKSEVLFQIGKAVALLAGSLFVLSLVEPDRLWDCVAALGAVMTEFAIFLEVFRKIGGDPGGGPMSMIDRLFQPLTSIHRAALKIGNGISIAALAGAILILAFAVKELSTIDSDKVIQGLVAIGVVMTELGIFLSKVDTSKINLNSGLGILLLATALQLMCDAVSKLGNTPLTTLEIGLGAIAALLFEIGAFTNMMSSDSKNYISAGIGMIALAAALLIMAEAVKSLGGIPAEQLGQGLVGVGLAMAGMVTAMNLLDDQAAIRKALSMTILAAAMIVMAKAVNAMGSIPVEQMGQGLAGIGASLLMLVLALDFLDPTSIIAKSVALIGVGVALNIIAAAIKSFGGTDLGTVLLALGAFAGILGIFALAGPYLTAFAGGMLALGATMVMFGAGVALVGAGVILLGTGLITLAGGIAALGPALASGATGIVTGMTILLAGFIAGIAAIAVAIAEGVVLFLVTLGNGAAQIVQVVVQLGTAIIQGIVELLPQIVNLILLIISELLRIIVEAAPQIVLAAAQLMVAFIEGITEQLPAIVEAAVVLIITFIDTMAVAINEHGSELVNSFANLIAAVIHFLAEAAFQFLWAAVEWIAQLVMGVVDGIGDVITGFSDLCNQAIECVVGFVDKFVQAGCDLVQGIIDGITSMAVDAWNAISGLASDLWEGFKSAIGANSPSKLFKKGGKYMVDGISVGLKQYGRNAVDSVVDLGENLVDSFNDVITSINDVVNSDIEMTPTITPVLDLNSVVSGASALNGLFGTSNMSSSLTVGARLDNIGAIASLNSKWNTFSNGDVVNSINELHNDISDLNSRIEEMNEKDATYEFNLNTQLDGRNIARSTARYNKKELALLDRNTNRKGGKVR